MDVFEGKYGEGNLFGFLKAGLVGLIVVSVSSIVGLVNREARVVPETSVVARVYSGEDESLIEKVRNSAELAFWARGGADYTELKNAVDSMMHNCSKMSFDARKEVEGEMKNGLEYLEKSISEKSLGFIYQVCGGWVLKFINFL